MRQLPLQTPKAIFDFITVINIFFALKYLVIPIVFLINPEKQFLWSFLSLMPNAANDLMISFIVVIAHFSLILGYSISQRSDYEPKLVLKPKVGDAGAFKLITLALCFFSLSLYIYSLGHGGLFGLATSGAIIRSGRQLGGFLEYFKYVANGITYIPCLYLSLMIYSKSHNAKKWTSFLFVFSLIMTGIYSLGTGGRGAVGMSLIMPYLLWQNCKRSLINRWSILMVAIMSCFLIFMIHYGRSAIYSLTALQSNESFSESFMQHYSSYNISKSSQANSHYDWLIIILSRFDHEFASLYPVLYSPEHYEIPRLFWDYPRSILALIPGQQAPDVIVRSRPSRLNQNFFELLANDRKIGYVPLGWIGIKIVNGGIAWLVIHGFVAGFLGGCIYKIILSSGSTIAPAISLLFSFFFMNHVLAVEPQEMIFRNLNLMIYFLLFFKFFRVCIKKKALRCNIAPPSLNEYPCQFKID